MAEFPEEVIRKAAEVRLRQYDSEYNADHLTWKDFASEVTEILDAVAEDLGNHAAEKIAEHRDSHGDSMPPDRLGTWRRHFGIAARIASRAFLGDGDLKAIAARDLAAGNFVACQAPEDGQ